MTDNRFVVAQFEHAVYTRQHELAGQLLLRLLGLIDEHFGDLPPSLTARGYSNFRDMPALVEHVVARLAAAITALFADPEFQLSPNGFLQTLPLQRWLGLIFAHTPMRNADHVIYSLNNLGWDSEVVQWKADDVYKMALITVPDSQVALDLDMIWQASPALAVNLAIAWVSPRFLGTPAAHHRREVVLGWLPERLPQLSGEDLRSVPINVWHDLYMHCSYAQRHDRHKVKQAIHETCHAVLQSYGITDLVLPPVRDLPRVDGKPVMLVLLEWFHASHSVYRTHSTSLRATRENFYVIGVGLNRAVDAAGAKVFDEFIGLDGRDTFTELQMLRTLAAQRQPSVFYMPSVGMYLSTIFAASLRLAPVQLTALGHAASTHSPWVDYFAVDEDFIGDPSTFTEKLISLPVDAMPFVHSSELANARLDTQQRHRHARVRIAVTASTMKLNPPFLEACARIKAQAAMPLEFCFFVGQARELMLPVIRRMVVDILGPDVHIHPHLPYSEYLEQVSQCDMFITPFPYGNMNGIADAVVCGMPGICKRGAHVHECIDVGMFRRLGLPEWTIAGTVDEYVAAAVRMADNGAERRALGEALKNSNALDNLYRGRPQILGERLRAILDAL